MPSTATEGGARLLLQQQQVCSHPATCSFNAHFLVSLLFEVRMKRPRKPSRGCRSAGRVTAQLLLSFLACPQQTAAGWTDGWVTGPNQVPIIPLPPSSPPELELPTPSSPAQHDFTLRHIFHHGTYLHPKLHRRLDVQPDDDVWILDDGSTDKNPQRSFHIRSRGEPIQRLSDRRYEVVDALMSAARLGYPAALDASAWTIDDVPAPNVTDKETVLSLANMAANAYIKVPGTEDWEDVQAGFNVTDDFGWENDGLRGHIFADEGNRTVVIGLKGTTPAVFDGSGSTSKDKENDNLFFSCCCGQGGHYLWRQVCDCSTAAYTCNSTCLLKTLYGKNRYYSAAQELYGNVTELYPNSTIWMAGHSLGGSVSSLLGLTFGLPVTTFEAVPEALPAYRLGLPTPPGFQTGNHQARNNTGAYHFGHTADPIFVGTCNAATSACTIGGYAMETQCHTGKVCIYDTVADKSWRVSARTHPIRSVIKDVIKEYDTLPECVPDSTPDEPCVDCFNWKYYKSNGSDATTSSTSSSSSMSLTRTTTCHTPGWWGCLDESTTTSETTPLSTETVTTSTTTCLKWGWFGNCLDPVTTNTTITSTVPITSDTADALTVTTTSAMPERGHHRKVAVITPTATKAPSR